MGQYERTKRYKEKNREKVNENQRKYRTENQDKYKASKQKRLQKILDWYRDYKSTLSCERCGESHPSCIQFHHKDPSEKEGQISAMAGKGVSIERIKTEIDKCEVLCANCHAKEHWDQKNPPSS